MKLSVIIVSYNVRYYVCQCIKSVLASDTLFPIEILVADNNSTDGTVEYINKVFPHDKHPNLHIIANKRNLGFGRANNRALRQATGEYILFLNPDTMIGEHTIDTCIKRADALALGERMGVMGVYMMYSNGRFAYESRRGIPTPFTAFCKISGLNALLPHSHRFGRYYMRYLDENEEAEIDIVSGAFMLGRKDVIVQLGGFDKDYFMYGEDIDLSYRMLTSEHINYYLPTPILHYKGESTEKSSLKYVHRFYEAMYIFFDKHYSLHGNILKIPIRCAIYARGFVALLTQSIKRLQSFFNMNELTDQEHYVAFIHPDNIQEFSFLCELWALDVTMTECDSAMTKSDITSMDESMIKQGDIVIYDSDAYSYDKILQFLRHSNHSNAIGLYHRDMQVIITHRRVLAS